MAKKKPTHITRELALQKPIIQRFYFCDYNITTSSPSFAYLRLLKAKAPRPNRKTVVGSGVTDKVLQ